MGSWLSYGLGQENADLPSFVVLITKDKTGQPLGATSGETDFFHRGIKASSFARRRIQYSTSTIRKASAARAGGCCWTGCATARPSIRRHAGRGNQIADRPVRDGVPHADEHSRRGRLSNEPKEVHDLYGPDIHKPGTFAANCLLARRLSERGVRFVQLYHQDWDHHSGLPAALPQLCRETDQPAAAWSRT